jgi:hypothetical protein
MLAFLQPSDNATEREAKILAINKFRRLNVIFHG